MFFFCYFQYRVHTSAVLLSFPISCYCYAILFCIFFCLYLKTLTSNTLARRETKKKKIWNTPIQNPKSFHKILELNQCARFFRSSLNSLIVLVEAQDIFADFFSFLFLLSFTWRYKWIFFSFKNENNNNNEKKTTQEINNSKNFIYAGYICRFFWFSFLFF